MTVQDAGRNVGTMSVNHHIHDSIMTPNIPDLIGGADAFGLTSLLSTDAMFASLADDHRNAFGLMHIMDHGPAGMAANWDGYDMLLFMNLTNKAILNPMLGVGMSGFQSELRTGGFNNDPLFGGSGDQVINELGAYEIYATLIAEGTSDWMLSGNGFSRSGTSALTPGFTASMTAAVPEPSTLAVTGLLLVGTCWHLRRRRQLAARSTASDNIDIAC